MSDRFTDTKGRPVVAVTGMGLVTSLGWGKSDNWAALMAGRSGITAIDRFPTDGLRTTIAGTVTSRCGHSAVNYSAHDLSLEIATAAAAEAVAQAGLVGLVHFPGPLVVATPPSELEWPQLMRLHRAEQGGEQADYSRLRAAARTGAFADLSHHVRFAAIADALQQRFGTAGEPLSICTACASGSSAVQFAMEAIRRGQTEAALCVATDATVHPEGLIRFSLLSALSTRNERPQEASRPFTKSRDGFVIAEGAGAMVLESYAHARARGAEPLAFVLGAGEKADSYHRTRSQPDGKAIVGAIEKALLDAGVGAEHVDHVNAHGTSTPENDRMECVSLRAVFGDRLRRLPITSNKSQIGHTLIAAGAVEAVISAMSLATGVIPPTINYRDPDPELDLDVVANTARRVPMKTVLSNSFGFGGQNVCLVMSSKPN